MNTKTLLPEYARNAHGFIGIEEREKLFELAGNVPLTREGFLVSSGRILNIGVEYGASLICLRAGNAHAILIGVDLDCTKIVWPNGKKDKSISLVTMDSAKLVERWNDANILDLIFVDGDHGHDGVIKDIQYLKWLNINGVVMFHDCYDWEKPNETHHLVPGVMQAVDDWFIGIMKGDNSFIELPKVGTSRLFQRIK